MRYVLLFIFRHLFPQNNIFSSRIFWEESPYDTKLVVQIRPVKGHRNCFNEYLGKNGQKTETIATAVLYIGRGEIDMKK